mmetsp:Transcript_55763/g.104599  ORF Transcript_55763/g.104599 Transcript_55763/m.104599 type:complete len:278 (-) Transcript_55763:100-933(-)
MCKATFSVSCSSSRLCRRTRSSLLWTYLARPPEACKSSATRERHSSTNWRSPSASTGCLSGRNSNMKRWASASGVSGACCGRGGKARTDRTSSFGVAGGGCEIRDCSGKSPDSGLTKSPPSTTKASFTSTASGVDVSCGSALACWVGASRAAVGGSTFGSSFGGSTFTQAGETFGLRSVGRITLARRTGEAPVRSCGLGICTACTACTARAGVGRRRASARGATSLRGDGEVRTRTTRGTVEGEAVWGAGPPMQTGAGTTRRGATGGRRAGYPAAAT